MYCFRPSVPLPVLLSCDLLQPVASSESQKWLSVSKLSRQVVRHKSSRISAQSGNCCEQNHKKKRKWLSETASQRLWHALATGFATDKRSSELRQNTKPKLLIWNWLSKRSEGVCEFLAIRAIGRAPLQCYIVAQVLWEHLNSVPEQKHRFMHRPLRKEKDPRWHSRLRSYHFPCESMEKDTRWLSSSAFLLLTTTLKIESRKDQ